MVQLRSCYFCGTTGALSEYEPLPRTVVTDESTPRVVLCDRCHTKLGNVLAPLAESVERAGLSESVEADQPPATGTPTDGRSLDESDDASGRTDSSTQEVTFPESAPTDAVERVTDDSDTAETAETDPGDGADDPPESASPPVESDERADAAGERELGDGTETADASNPDAKSVDDVDGGEDVEQDGAHAPSSSADLDRVYHKLLRFLRNREFPIPRAEAEAVAQSAYDLSATEASQVIQRAVDRDVLQERDGELHRR